MQFLLQSNKYSVVFKMWHSLFTVSHIARYAARSQRCIGLLIGVISIAPTPVLKFAMADDVEMPSVYELTMASAGSSGGLLTQQYVCQQVFGDNVNPAPLVLKLFGFVDGPGTYSCIDVYNRAASFEVVHALQLESLNEYDSEYFVETDAVTVCVGWLQGSAARVPICGIVMRKESVTADPDNSFLFIIQLISDDTVSICAQAESILAASYSHSNIKKNSPYPTTPLGQCIQQAMIDTQQELDDAASDLKLCIRLAEVGFAASLLLCLVPGGQLLCIAGGIGTLGVGAGGCMAWYIHKVTQANEHLSNRLSACLGIPPAPPPSTAPSAPSGRQGSTSQG